MNLIKNSIILIPGLHLNPARQMSVWRTADFFWPKEITNHLIEARVLAWTFTSNKKPFIWDTQSIHNLAICLLNDIRKDVHRTRPRPIVFVSYSLGGLVLKRVCFNSRSSAYSSLISPRHSFRLSIAVKAMR